MTEDDEMSNKFGVNILLATCMMAGLALGLMSYGAKAAYIIDYQQVGSDVVVTGNGSINTSGLDEINGIVSSGYPGINASLAYVSFGAYGINTFDYGGLTGPASFGTTSTFEDASSTSGNKIQLEGAYSSFTNGPELDIFEGYVSGSQLGLSTDTFSDTTIAELGLTQGRYVYTFGSGANADSVTVLIGVSATPLPSSAPMLGSALLALVAAGRGLKRKKAAAA